MKLAEILYNEIENRVFDLDDIQTIAELYAEDVQIRESNRNPNTPRAEEDLATLGEYHRKSMGYLEKITEVLTLYDFFMRIVPNHDAIFQQGFPEHKDYFDSLRQIRLDIQRGLLTCFEESLRG